MVRSELRSCSSHSDVSEATSSNSGRERGNVRREHSVSSQRRYELTNNGDGFLDAACSAKWATVLDALRRGSGR